MNYVIYNIYKNMLLKTFIIICSQSTFFLHNQPFLEKCKKKMNDKFNLKSKYKDKVNYQISLQSLFIALINQFATISMNKRNVRTTVTLPFLSINQIKFENEEDTIDLWDFIEERIHTISQNEILKGVKKETANTRIKKYRINYSIQLLEDILFEIGYRFTYKYIRKKDGNISLELVNKIYFNDILIFNKQSIKERGKEINHFLTQLMDQKNYIILEKNDNELQKLIYGK